MIKKQFTKRAMASKGSVALIGEKAFNLESLTLKGFPVPTFKVIDKTCFQNFMDHNGLGRKIEHLKHCDFTDYASTRLAHQKIQNLIKMQAMPAVVEGQIMQTLVSLSCDGPLMIRSSGVGEDSDKASFAGQLESFQIAGTPAQVIEAVRNCWASYWSERSLWYQHSRGVFLSGMGVIIQKRIDPAIAGVLFSRGPSPFENEIYIEYCHGHGEQLVSGKVTPGVIRFERDSLKIHADPALDNKYTDVVHQLVDESIRIEKDFCFPVDIEWAIDRSLNLSILQARPITSYHMEKKILWSNVNVNENYPEPITPILFSIAQKSYTYYFKNLARELGVSKKSIAHSENDFKNIIGLHGSRMYYNMTSIHKVIGLLPYSDILSSFFDNFVGADPCENKRQKEHSKNYSTVRLSWIATKTILSLLLAPLKARRFEKNVDQHLAKFYLHGKLIDNPDKNTLENRFVEFLKIRFYKWKDASIADFSAMISYGILGLFLNKTYRHDDARAKQNLLLQGISHLVSNEPTQRLWELSQIIRNDKNLLSLFKTEKNPHVILENITCRNNHSFFRKAFFSYLNKWGYRCSCELMLTEPNFREKPHKLVELLNAYLKNEKQSPYSIIKQKNGEKRKVLSCIKLDITQSKPVIGSGIFLLLRLLLFWTEKSIGYRERVRLRQALLYGHLRNTLLKLSPILLEKKIIGSINHIFFMTYREVRDCISAPDPGYKSILPVLEEREKKHMENAKMTLEDTFTLAEGARAAGSKYTSPAPPDKSGSRFKGMSACGGVVRGKARILKSVLEAKKIHPGDILVTKQTDPGWAPIFPLISGLIIERGGMLSHGAIVAREFGIPAVVGIMQITKIITDGQEVLVNGDDGSIQF